VDALTAGTPDTRKTRTNIKNTVPTNLDIAL